jgi:hypothetical protein
VNHCAIANSVCGAPLLVTPAGTGIGSGRRGDTGRFDDCAETTPLRAGGPRFAPPRPPSEATAPLTAGSRRSVSVRPSRTAARARRTLRVRRPLTILVAVARAIRAWRPRTIRRGRRPGGVRSPRSRQRRPRDVLSTTPASPMSRDAAAATPQTIAPACRSSAVHTSTAPRSRGSGTGSAIVRCPGEQPFGASVHVTRLPAPARRANMRRVS